MIRPTMDHKMNQLKKGKKNATTQAKKILEKKKSPYYLPTRPVSVVLPIPM